MRSCYAIPVPAKSGLVWRLLDCCKSPEQDSRRLWKGCSISKVKQLMSKHQKKRFFFNIVHRPLRGSALDRSVSRQKKPPSIMLPYIFVSQYCQADSHTSSV